VEVKIGVKGAPRELVVETDSTSDEIAAALRAVVGTEGAILELTDTKGRRILVPVEHIAFLEIGEQEQRRVGFGAMLSRRTAARWCDVVAPNKRHCGAM
jgi:hypothetical protein